MVSPDKIAPLAVAVFFACASYGEARDVRFEYGVRAGAYRFWSPGGFRQRFTVTREDGESWGGPIATNHSITKRLIVPGGEIYGQWLGSRRGFELSGGFLRATGTQVIRQESPNPANGGAAIETTVSWKENSSWVSATVRTGVRAPFYLGAGATLIHLTIEEPQTFNESASRNVQGTLSGYELKGWVPGWLVVGGYRFRRDTKLPVTLEFRFQDTYPLTKDDDEVVHQMGLTVGFNFGR